MFDYLVEVAEITGADRVGAVWVDEYVPGVVHPHLVVDLISSRPRRSFPPEPLHEAWAAGIPGSYEEWGGVRPDGTSRLAVALGSDGARGWFLIADSIAACPALDSVHRGRLMFLAGECSAVVLHRDLDGLPATETQPSFPGWRFLKDLEGHEEDEETTATVTRRFLVGRLIANLIDDDLAIPDDHRAESAQRARDELESHGAFDSVESAALHAVLDSYASGQLETLGSALRTLGQEAERCDHSSGALAAYECAFEVSAAVADARGAVEASRYAGRLSRRRAQWTEADRWYRLAFDVAQADGLAALAARSMSGLGLVKREMGNLPAARSRFREALALAETTSDREALASVHHDLMGLEQLAGDLDQALRHGWRAVNTYDSESGKTRCMAGLAGVLVEFGDWSAAEDAYAVVTLTSTEHYYLIYAHDALAYIAALRGDEAGFERSARRCDELDWEFGPESAKSEILYYRGLSYQALGRMDEARRWLERAVDFASEHKFNRVLFKAEEALSALEASEGVSAADSIPAPPEVRDGLRAMHRELIEVGG